MCLCGVPESWREKGPAEAAVPPSPWETSVPDEEAAQGPAAPGRSERPDVVLPG